MTTRRQVIDDDGNIIPPPPPESDVGQLIYLLEWARTREFVVGPVVKIGELQVQVADLRQARSERPAGSTERDVWAEHGHVDQ